MIHLLVGPDRHLVDAELRRLLAEYDPDNLNTTRFDKSAELSEIASAVATVGFFGSGRVVAAEGVVSRLSVAGKGSKKSDIEAVTRLLASVAPDNHLIIVDPDVASVPKAIRDALPKEGAIYAGAAPRGSDLLRWTQAEAERLGGSIEPRAAQVLLSRLFPNRWERADKPQYDKPPELAALTRSLDTLILYAGDGPVASADVEAMVAKESSDQLFAFTDSVMAGDSGKSIRLLHEEGVDDDSAARLLGYAGTQAEAAMVAAAMGRHESASELAGELGISEGRVARLQKSVGAPSAVAFGRDVADADRRLKTGKVRGVQGQLYDLLISRARKERGL